MPVFAYFLSANANNSFLQERLGTRSCPHAILLIIFFLISLIVSRLIVTLCDRSYIKFFILDMKCRSICGERKLLKHCIISNFFPSFMNKTKGDYCREWALFWEAIYLRNQQSNWFLYLGNIITTLFWIILKYKCIYPCDR